MPLDMALAAIATAPLSHTLAIAAVRKAIEVFLLGGDFYVRAAPPAPDASFNPFEELQAVHAAIRDAGGDATTARGVRDFLRTFGDKGHSLAAATDKLRKYRNGKGHPPVGVASEVASLTKLGHHALQFATPKDKADHEIMLEAVKQNGNSLDHAAPELKTDRKFNPLEKAYESFLEFKDVVKAHPITPCVAATPAALSSKLDAAEAAAAMLATASYPFIKDVDWTSDVYVKPLPGASPFEVTKAIDKTLVVGASKDGKLPQEAAVAQHKALESVEGKLVKQSDGCFFCGHCSQCNCEEEVHRVFMRRQSSRRTLSSCSKS